MHPHPPAVPDPGDGNRDTIPLRELLGALAERITGLAFRQAGDTVRIGLLLEQARRRAKHGVYVAWVRDKLPFSVPTAQRFRQVARAFAAFQSVHFEQFDESALYLLAEFRTPPEVRDRAVERANEGHRVTRGDALRMLAEFRAGEGTAPAAGAGAAPARRRCAALVRDKKGPKGATRVCGAAFDSTSPADRVCPQCRRREEKRDERERQGAREADEARWWRKFVKLVAVCPRVLVDEVADADHEGAGTLYVGTAYPADDAEPIRTTPALAGIEQVIGHLLGEPDLKRCAHCGLVKPTSEFNRDEPEAMGVFRHCRVCTKTRKAEARAAKKAGGESAA